MLKASEHDSRRSDHAVNDVQQLAGAEGLDQIRAANHPDGGAVFTLSLPPAPASEAVLSSP